MDMHGSAARLYDAARIVRGAVGIAAVAKLMNESPQTLKNWESRGVSAEGAIKAEMRLGCSAAWIRTGEGMMYRLSMIESTRDRVSEEPQAQYLSQPPDNVSSLPQEAAMIKLAPAEGYVRLPILAEAAAGAGSDPDAYELIEHVDVAEAWVRSALRANPATLRVLTARGQSMRGVVEDGDVMFVAPVTDFRDDGIYVIAVGGLLRVKRLRLLVRDRMLSIESTDGSPAETLPLGDVGDSLRICGRVLGAWSLRRM